MFFNSKKNHPFVDGNQRICVHAMLVFLEINGIFLEYKQEELIDIGLKLAEGLIDDKELFKWIIDHS